MTGKTRLPRIAFVDLTFNWPPVGGCWVDLKETMQRLQARGFDVHLFCPLWTDYYPRGLIESPLPFEWTRLPFSRFTFNAWHVRRRFGKAVRAWQPDLVFLADGYHLKAHLLAEFANDFPTWCRFYAYELLCLNLHYWLYGENRVCDGGALLDPERCHHCWHPGRTIYERLLRIIVGLPDHHPKQHFTHEYLAALAFTKWYRRRLPKWLQQARELIVYNQFIAGLLEPSGAQISVVPGGVDTRLFCPPEKKPVHSRPVILVPGRINDELKGFETVRQACRKLVDEGFEFEVRITAADEMSSDEPWLSNCGWIDQADMPDLYREADIVIVPSLWVEPFGLTAVEAMACGVPVVGARIGGIAESVVHEQTGLHFTAGNASELADCLRRLLQNPELGKQLGERGRKRCEELFDWDALVDRVYLPRFEKALRSDTD